jgi:hypothetical protein
MDDTTLPPRRVRHAADAALRADVRRRDRIDRYARAAHTPSDRAAHTPSNGGLIGRILAAVRPHAEA